MGISLMGKKCGGVMERSEYTQESPCQYVRYLLPDKPTGRGSPPGKRKNRKEKKKNGE